MGYSLDDSSLWFPSVLEALTVETLLTAANSLAWFLTTVSSSLSSFYQMGFVNCLFFMIFASLTSNLVVLCIFLC